MYENCHKDFLSNMPLGRKRYIGKRKNRTIFFVFFSEVQKRGILSYATG